MKLSKRRKARLFWYREPYFGREFGHKAIRSVRFGPAMDEALSGHLPERELLLPLKGVPKAWTPGRVHRGKQIVRSGRLF